MVNKISERFTKQAAGLVVPQEDDAEKSLLCQHPGCGNLWSVQGPRGSKCSHHYWIDEGPRPATRSMVNWKGPDYGDDHLRFAKSLRDAHAAGWHITNLQQSYYKNALRIES